MFVLLLLKVIIKRPPLETHILKSFVLNNNNKKDPISCARCLKGKFSQLRTETSAGATHKTKEHVKVKSVQTASKRNSSCHSPR